MGLTPDILVPAYLYCTMYVNYTIHKREGYMGGNEIEAGTSQIVKIDNISINIGKVGENSR